MAKLVLCVSGWRNMSDQSVFERGMDLFIGLYGRPDEIITGGARGADAMAKRYAQAHGIIYTEAKYIPQWKLHGKKAGPMRNADLVRDCTHVLAFPSAQGSGTQDAIRKAEAAGKPVVVINLE